MKLCLAFGLSVWFYGVLHAQTPFFVTPQATNPLLEATDSHLVVLPATMPRNQLLVHFGGTGSSPFRTTYYCQTAAELGYHVISITYPNDITVVSACDDTTDPECFDRFRHEICFGTPLSAEIDVDSLNSIQSRIQFLLDYLNTQQPSNDWGQYLNADTLNWNLCAFSGHSQGSGHAAYLGKKRDVSRVIMFSGANDYVEAGNPPVMGAWVSDTGLTPLNRIYGFLHFRDNFDKQHLVWQTMGLFSSGDDTTLVDNDTPPYGYSHTLYTNATPGSPLKYHGSTVVDAATPLDNQGIPLFRPVWQYLLGAADTVTAEPEPNAIVTPRASVGPNPTAENIWVQCVAASRLSVFAVSGLLLFESEIPAGETRLSLNTLPNGIYILQLGFADGSVQCSRLVIQR